MSSGFENIGGGSKITFFIREMDFEPGSILFGPGSKSRFSLGRRISNPMSSEFEHIGGGSKITFFNRETCSVGKWVSNPMSSEADPVSGGSKIEAQFYGWDLSHDLDVLPATARGATRYEVRRRLILHVIGGPESA